MSIFKQFYHHTNINSVYLDIYSRVGKLRLVDLAQVKLNIVSEHFKLEHVFVHTVDLEIFVVQIFRGSLQPRK